MLPESLVNKIAAGEVVERPASVVKELLENSLDAGAGRVVIEIEAGGKRLVRVSDDGEGMSADDALLAIERHATSKLKNEADLFAICSLGFRGEALPSIASVSRLWLRTRDRDSELGTAVRVEAGVVREVKKEAMAQGTCVEVRSLFFNVPARRKFLKSVETELGHITELVDKLAFACPGTSLELIHQGKTMLAAPAASRLEDRARQILDRELAARLLPVAREFKDSLGSGTLLVKGLVSPPDLTFSTTRHLYLYINRRYVRDKLLTHSILEAYRTLIPKMRYPAVILFLEMPASEVDVNVHPTKLEVRFPAAANIYQAVIDTIHPALMAGPRLFLQPEKSQDEHKARVEQATEKFFQNRKRFRLEPPPFQPKISALDKSPEERKNTADWTAKYREEKLSAQLETEKPNERPVTPSPSQEIFSSLRIIGQFHSNYLLLESEDSLIVIDQHAAHERLNFEKLKNWHQSHELGRQSLLFPEVVELDFQQAQVLNQNLELLDSIGFEVQPFGGNSFLVKATPALLGSLELGPLFADLADELSELGKISSIDQRLENLFAVVACHCSVRAGQPLSEREIQSLLSELERNPFPGQCPHGRPALWKIPLKEIEKKFSR